MSFKNITFPQVLILVACLASVIVAYKFEAPYATAVGGLVGTIVAFMLGRDPSPPSLPSAAPGVAALAFLLSLMALSAPGCAGAQSATADSAYGTETANCLQDAGSRAEVDACRRDVKAKFGILDGGAK